MNTKPASPDAYLAALPEDRRAAIQAVRAVILKNLDKDYEEGIQYGMIAYYVPHRVHPAGYHCDPRQPLPFAAIASQKNYMSLHLMCVYSCDPKNENPELTWLREAWKKSGKKLDMGKACLRFKRVDDLALDVIGELFRRMPARKYIEMMTKALEAPRPKRESAPAKAAARKKPASARKTS